MGTSFDRWEKDPFFPAAEEVQESADRMESTYRTWIHVKKDLSSEWDSEQLHRDLNTALGTTKWQLDEFQRAVESSYDKYMSDDARNRHCEFIVAIEDQVAKIEKSLKDTAHSEGKGTPRWVHLNKGERDELALFLSGSPGSENKTHSTNYVTVNGVLGPAQKESTASFSKNSRNLVDLMSLDAQEEKLQGHRRTASAVADSGAWKISISDDSSFQKSSNGQPQQPPRKIPSFSGFLNYMESPHNGKWPKHCVRKWKAIDHQQESNAVLLPTQYNRQAMNASFGKSKSCMEFEDCQNKPLHGWQGPVQRQLQRSQYQIQYSRPVQFTIWTVVLFLIVLIAVHIV